MVSQVMKVRGLCAFHSALGITLVTFLVQQPTFPSGGFLPPVVLIIIHDHIISAFFAVICIFHALLPIIAMARRFYGRRVGRRFRRRFSGRGRGRMSRFRGSRGRSIRRGGFGGRRRFGFGRQLRTGRYFRQVFECDYPAGTFAFSNTLTPLPTGVGGALVVQATLIPNLSSFAAVWQMYRINKVHVRFVPTQDERNGGLFYDGATNSVGQVNGGKTELLTTLDFDDSIVPTSRAYLVQQTAYLRKSRGGVHKRSYYPSLVSAMEYPNPGGTPASWTVNQMIKPRSLHWLPLTGDGVSIPHYGLKWWLDPPVGSAPPYELSTYNIWISLDVSFMNRD